MSKCQCKVCTDCERYFKIIYKLESQEDRDWMEDFYGDYGNKMLDANVNEAIIDGTWQNADEIIAYAREKVAKRKL